MLIVAIICPFRAVTPSYMQDLILLSEIILTDARISWSQNHCAMV